MLSDLLRRKLRLKIYSVACAESQGKINEILASFGLRWWQHMLVIGLYEHCIATDVNGSIKTVLVLSIQLSPYFQTVQQIAFYQNPICRDRQ